MGEDVQDKWDEAHKKVAELEDDPPKDLEDWPSGRAKYETFGGPEHESSYEDSAATKLGEADVRHHEDGKVTVGGEEVDNPDEYKGEPIPGGPTDPDTPKISGERDLTDEGKGEGDGDGEADDDDGGEKEGD